MKKTLLSLATLGILALASCEKVKDAIFPSFDTAISEVEVVVPIVANTASEINIGTTTTNFNVDSVIRKYTANQFSLNNAGSVKVTSVTLDLLNGDADNNFSNFESVKVAISSDSKPTPVVVASTVIASNVSPIVINGNDVNLKDYLKDTHVTYTISGKCKKATTKPLQVAVEVALHVN